MPASTLVAATEQLVNDTLAALQRRNYPENRAPRKAKARIHGARDLSRRVSRLLTDMQTVNEIETLRAELKDPDNEAIREQIQMLIRQLQQMVN